MPTFKFSFIGQEKGAIGIMYPITATSAGDTYHEAKIALYDRFENIQQCQFLGFAEPNLEKIRQSFLEWFGLTVLIFSIKVVDEICFLSTGDDAPSGGSFACTLTKTGNVKKNSWRVLTN